ncbi:MAG: ribonuclease HII [Clostridiales bacterium]|nr:ribonuclease HII [Clostridiales bacterium]MDY6117246.1 ribonuclease HII [Anaerovoracaceae bacterium]
MTTKAERERIEKTRLEEMKSFDIGNSFGFEYLIGVDEVGRGPLAGPVVACAVIMPKDWDVPGINDSKKLTENRRNELALKIKDRSVAIGLGFVNSKKIDRFNIRNATKMAMIIAVRRCIENFQEQGYGSDEIKDYETKNVDLPAIENRSRETGAGMTFDVDSNEDLDKALKKSRIKILIDGDMEIPIEQLEADFEKDGFVISQETVIKGDSKSLAIGAASIVAKVARDEFMKEYSKRAPEFGFEKHKGYGTKAHYEAISSYGLSPIHRKTFLKKVLDKIEEELI